MRPAALLLLSLALCWAKESAHRQAAKKDQGTVHDQPAAQDQDTKKGPGLKKDQGSIRDQQTKKGQGAFQDQGLVQDQDGFQDQEIFEDHGMIQMQDAMPDTGTTEDGQYQRTFEDEGTSRILPAARITNGDKLNSGSRPDDSAAEEGNNMETGAENTGSDPSTENTGSEPSTENSEAVNVPTSIDSGESGSANQEPNKNRKNSGTSGSDGSAESQGKVATTTTATATSASTSTMTLAQTTTLAQATHGGRGMNLGCQSGLGREDWGGGQTEAGLGSEATQRRPGRRCADLWAPAHRHCNRGFEYSPSCNFLYLCADDADVMCIVVEDVEEEAATEDGAKEIAMWENPSWSACFDAYTMCAEKKRIAFDKENLKVASPEEKKRVRAAPCQESEPYHIAKCRIFAVNDFAQHSMKLCSEELPSDKHNLSLNDPNCYNAYEACAIKKHAANSTAPRIPKPKKSSRLI